MLRFIRSLALVPLLLTSSAWSEQADFNAVGKHMAIMLQNSHFARLPYNEELGQKFLTSYLKNLDPQKLYFHRKDVDHFMETYGSNLHSLLLQGRAIPVAEEIYALFRSRVEQRVDQADKILQEGHFDFAGDETFTISRKNADWPRDEEDAARLWRLQIKDAVLSETLRREMITKLANDQGKADPSKKDRQPAEKVSLRYKRFLTGVRDADAEEIANYLLSAVASTYDPHTDYMSFREMSRFRDGMKNELIGIGALLQGEEDGATKIMGIVVGGPADKEGSLKLNDRVVAVDSMDTGKSEQMVDIMFMTIDKVVDLIRGKEGTTVALKVEPAAGPSGSTKIVRIRREKVEMKDEQASGELILKQDGEKGIKRLGVLTLPSFYADFEDGKVRCSVDVERILQRLVAEKIDGLILDLRNNGGGSLEEVRRMTGFFMDRGPVVQVKNTLGQTQVKDSENPSPIYGGPMVILTDKSSASASEILAGALQDVHRAVIVGDSSTFGKGTVQQPMDIGRMLPLFAARNKAGHLKVTIQKFYRPSGSSTQMQGVVSDIALPSVIDALDVGEAYLDHALPHDRIRRAAEFRPLDAQNLFLPTLKEKSQKRVSQCNDFQYIIEDVIETKERIQSNELPLNIEKRRALLAKSDEKAKVRNAERKARFEITKAADRKKFTFHPIKLDDLDANLPLRPIDPDAERGDFMRRAKSETEDLDDTPEWPSGLDPVKREGLMVLGDLVELTESARVAGVNQ
jgi:carboxyl-terminal processing protease